MNIDMKKLSAKYEKLATDILADRKFHVSTLGENYADEKTLMTLRHMLATAYLDGANDRREFEIEEAQKHE